MLARTDLALETAESLPSGSRLEEKDLLRREKVYGKVKVIRLEVQSDKAAEALKKPHGKYITVEIPPLSDNGEEQEETAEIIGGLLRELLPTEGTVLVVGLGNRRITPDALGPLASDQVLATRHITGEFARTTGLNDLRSTAVVATDVLGHTGMESAEIVKGLVDMVRPCAVVALDALAARSLSRLGCTVQISDTGIIPGSGVGNRRFGLTAEALGVPVIGMGIPTVVDAATMIGELTGQMPTEGDAARMMVTPREIDLVIERASRLVGMSLNAALQPSYSPMELAEIAR